MLDRSNIEGLKLIRCCRVNGWLQCFVSIDAGLYHLSVSHPRRYPTWDEIKALRYSLLPDEKTFAILFPPMAQYVNLHPNCFHLHEVPEMHESQPLSIFTSSFEAAKMDIITKTQPK